MNKTSNDPGCLSRPRRFAAFLRDRSKLACALCARVTLRLERVHSDQRGTISIVSVFALLMFTMLLVMIVNVGTHFDDKLKMQNAADASTYSGGVVLARGMNGLAFTNHLISDVFAMTAFLREARDRNAEPLVPPM